MAALALPFFPFSFPVHFSERVPGPRICYCQENSTRTEVQGEPRILSLLFHRFPRNTVTVWKKANSGALSVGCSRNRDPLPFRLLCLCLRVPRAINVLS